jgi:Predicted phosphoribosyltransferases
LVDDGIATGSTVFVVVEWLKTQKIDTCLIASPVIPSNVFKELKTKNSLMYVQYILQIILYL